MRSAAASASAAARAAARLSPTASRSSAPVQPHLAATPGFRATYRDIRRYVKINENHVPVISGDRVSGTAFENPTTLLASSTDVAEFSLREVSLPFPGAGVELGKARAFGRQCADVRLGDPKVLPAETFIGSRPTYYKYRVKLMLSALN